MVKYQGRIYHHCTGVKRSLFCIDNTIGFSLSDAELKEFYITLSQILAKLEKDNEDTREVDKEKA